MIFFYHWAQLCDVAATGDAGITYRNRFLSQLLQFQSNSLLMAFGKAAADGLRWPKWPCYTHES